MRSPRFGSWALGASFNHACSEYGWPDMHEGTQPLRRCPPGARTVLASVRKLGVTPAALGAPDISKPPSACTSRPGRSRPLQRGSLQLRGSCLETQQRRRASVGRTCTHQSACRWRGLVKMRPWKGVHAAPANSVCSEHWLAFRASLIAFYLWGSESSISTIKIILLCCIKKSQNLPVLQ